MTDGWKSAPTNTHQDHVIAHVIGATVLGYFTADDALHVLLDIGFIWTIYLDAEMGLVPQAMAISELNVSEAEKEALVKDIRACHESSGVTEEGLSMVTPAPFECLIQAVEVDTRGEARRVLIRGEATSLAVEASPLTREMRVETVA